MQGGNGVVLTIGEYVDNRENSQILAIIMGSGHGGAEAGLQG